MSHDVHVVVLTNVLKTLTGNVEIKMQIPKGDPWSFPFAHKQILAERVNDFDLFIYSEDDTLITEGHIDAFLKACKDLNENEIAGFIRSELDQDGAISLSTINYFFNWKPSSIVQRGSKLFAYFSNEHSASYVLTQDQLRTCIESGGFLVSPHQHRYDLLVTAATDPYTQCGFKKLICISNIKDFTLPHLPNKYVGQMGLGEDDLNVQITAMEAIHNRTRPGTVLMNTETKLELAKWSKSYYEPTDDHILDLVGNRHPAVLSFGCGWGAMEVELQKRGAQVTAIPLDSIIGACAEARGIQTIYGDSRSVFRDLEGRHFDCILAINILHLSEDPVRLLASFRELLAPDGLLIVKLPNLASFSVFRKRLRRDSSFGDLESFDRTGIQETSFSLIKKWFAAAGFGIEDVRSIVPERAQIPNRLSAKLAEKWFAEEFTISAKKLR
jgi:SAM-dependent methyltransferase